MTGGLPVVTDTEGVRRITLNRPEVANALTVDDLAVIEAAVRDAPDGVRVILFAGAAGGVFSAGMHVETFLSTPAGEGRALIERVGSCVGAVRLSGLPTVAVVEGHCLGAAFELALACDVRMCTPSATFGLPEVRLGIPSVVDAALLREYVGLGLAKEMTLTGAIFPVDRVPSLANVLVAPDALEDAVGEMVQMLTAPTREVIAAQKALFETWLNVGLREGIETSKQVFGDVFALSVTQAAVAAYEAGRRQRS